MAWVLSRCIYRFNVQGDENIPTKGAASLVCNHVSFVDALLLMAASPCPVYFIMDHQIFKVPVLGWLFRLAKAIPIAPSAQDAAAYEAAFDKAAQVLKEGDLLCIFPEGGITRDGTLQEFKGGIMKILMRTTRKGTAVQVIPMALTHLRGSFFSRVERGTAMVRPFRRGMFSRVGLHVGIGIAPEHVEPSTLQARVSGLL